MKVSVAILLFGLALGGVALVGPALADDYRAPRTSTGQPDLQGNWQARGIRPMEARPDTPDLVISETQSQALADKIAAEVNAWPGLAQDPETGQLYLDEAKQGMGMVRGQRRSRQVIEPADGKIPYSRAGRGEASAVEASFTKGGKGGLADNPENRGPDERCLIGFGPPPVTVDLPVNLRKIVQTKDAVVIWSDYGEARIIPFATQHGPAALASRTGDAIARWEGETLVVETLHPQYRDHILPVLVVPETATVIERFTRVSKGELVYQYTVVDPKTFTGPWLAEYSLYATETPPVEFACAEGNYSLANVLAGARYEEQQARGGKAGQ